MQRHLILTVRDVEFVTAQAVALGLVQGVIDRSRNRIRLGIGGTSHIAPAAGCVGLISSPGVPMRIGVVTAARIDILMVGNWRGGGIQPVNNALHQKIARGFSVNPLKTKGEENQFVISFIAQPTGTGRNDVLGMVTLRLLHHLNLALQCLQFFLIGMGCMAHLPNSLFHLLHFICIFPDWRNAARIVFRINKHRNGRVQRIDFLGAALILCTVATVPRINIQIDPV